MTVKVQKFLNKNFANFWPWDFWPPSSPDLNPLDFYWWRVNDRRSNHVYHSNLDSLKEAITVAWNTINKAEIQTVCSQFRPRVEAVICGQGKHIEHLN